MIRVGFKPSWFSRASMLGLIQSQIHFIWIWAKFALEDLNPFWNQAKLELGGVQLILARFRFEFMVQISGLNLLLSLIWIHGFTYYLDKMMSFYQWITNPSHNCEPSIQKMNSSWTELWIWSSIRATNLHQTWVELFFIWVKLKSPLILT